MSLKCYFLDEYLRYLVDWIRFSKNIDEMHKIGLQTPKNGDFVDEKQNLKDERLEIVKNIDEIHKLGLKPQ